MLVKMNRHDYELLTRVDLSKGCFEPLINVYKGRMKEEASIPISEMKEQFYKQLTEGQQALFMFYVYYHHVSKSIPEFYWWSAYFMAQPKSWSALKASIKYFDDDSLVSLLDKIELVLKRHDHPATLEAFAITREHLNFNKELQELINSLYDEFNKIAPMTICKINKYIENNLQQFVEIND